MRSARKRPIHTEAPTHAMSRRLEMVDAYPSISAPDEVPAAPTPARPDAGWAMIGFTDFAALLGATTVPSPHQGGASFPVRRLRGGEVLHRTGDKFDAIYVVRSGFLK